MSTITDTDILIIHRDGVDYKTTAADLKEYVLAPPPPPPWEGHNGGIFHIKDVQYAALRVKNGPYTAWDIDGTNERQITEVAIGEELVVATNPDCGELFYANDVPDWDFGEFTNTSKVTKMNRMFNICKGFTGDVSNWDTSNVTDMSEMFRSVDYSFNSDISGWNTSKVTKMNNMFHFARIFNQDIGDWDTSNVTDMSSMFRSAAQFNQDLSGWCVSNITSKPTYFDSTSGFENQTAKQPQWGTCP